MAWCRRIISRIAEEDCDLGFFSLRTWVLNVPSRGTFSLFSELQRASAENISVGYHLLGPLVKYHPLGHCVAAF